MSRKMTDRKGSLSLALGLGLVLMLARSSNGAAPGPTFGAAFIPSAVAVGVSGAARGGVQVCLAEHSVAPQKVSFDPILGVLSGTNRVAVPLRIALTNSEVAEVMSVARQMTDGCVEVSVDLVADRSTSFISAELESAPTLSQKLLQLDGEIGGLLEGAFELPPALASKVRLPGEEARRMLDEQSGEAAYRELALAYVTPPRSWHSTSMRIDPSRAQPHDIQMTVKPTVTLVAADGRRLHPEAGLAALATRPYRPLAERLATSPAAFEGTLPSMRDGLRYARALALVSACLRAGQGRCALQVAPEGTARATRRGSDETLRMAAELQQLVEQLRNTETGLTRTGVKALAMMSVWREHRLSLDPRKLSPEQRTAVFIDETLTWYRDLGNAQTTTSLHSQSAAYLQRLIAGVDTRKGPYAGWADLGQFILGVWQSRPLPELSEHLARAYAQAEKDRDGALKYQILRTSERLLPVMQSGLLITERQGRSRPTFVPAFDPTGSLARKRLSAEEYLEELARGLPVAMARHLDAEYQQIDQEIGALFAPRNGRRASSSEVLATMARFERSSLLQERRLINGHPLLQYARLQLAAAQAFAQEQNVEAALQRARLLDSIAQIAAQGEDEMEESTTRLVKDWAMLIRREVRL